MSQVFVGLDGYVSISGTTVARIIQWRHSPGPQFSEHAGATDSDVTVYNIRTGFTGSFTAEKLPDDSGQESIGITPTACTIVLGDGEDAFSLGNCYAWKSPGYTKGQAVQNAYQYRDR